MNLSGRSVAPLVRETGCSLEDLLIVCDDVNLDLGVLRLRRQGSAGGHKGLHSIIHNLHSQAFPRLRLGVGRPPQGADMMDYVLHPFRRAERPIVDHVVEQAVQAIQTWAYHGIEEAMNRFNQRVPPLVDNG
jgi:PTH1 family peptidyl-tRNA hydrolase